MEMVGETQIEYRGILDEISGMCQVMSIQMNG